MRVREAMVWMTPQVRTLYMWYWTKSRKAYWDENVRHPRNGGANSLEGVVWIAVVVLRRS